jgi:DNA-directed RNA polymerase subunit RPC12/RpoP
MITTRWQKRELALPQSPPKMSFKFYCSNCGQKLEAEELHIGSIMNCPSCSHPLEIPKPTTTANSTPPPLGDVNWHYELDGQAIGPVSECEIQKLVAAGKITSFTRVWTKGMSVWVNACDSSLNKLLPSSNLFGVHTVDSLTGSIAVFFNKLLHAESEIKIKVNKILSNIYSKSKGKGRSKNILLKKTILAVIALIVILFFAVILSSGNRDPHVYAVASDISKCIAPLKNNSDIKSSFIQMNDDLIAIRNSKEYSLCPDDYKDAFVKMQTCSSLLKDSINNVPTDALSTVLTGFINAMQGEWDGGAGRMESELKARSANWENSLKEMDRLGLKYGVK